jgi:outer membrane lipoprotein-sorting protein
LLRKRDILTVLALVVAAAITAGLAGAARAAAAQQPAKRTSWTLDSVLRQLDNEAKQFRALTANLERTKVTVVVNDRAVESGQIWVRRDDKMLIEFAQPDRRTVLRRGDELAVYHPRTKRLEEYDLGRHRALVEQFLLLGFGTSGGDLRKGYLVTLLDEQVQDGKRVVWLELTPKAEEIRNHITRIHLWIDQATWLPVRQKFFEPGSGDYLEVHYTSVVRNPQIPDSRFRPNWPRDVTRVKR